MCGDRQRQLLRLRLLVSILLYHLEWQSQRCFAIFNLEMESNNTGSKCRALEHERMEELYKKQRRKEEAAIKFEEERRAAAAAREEAKNAKQHEKQILLQEKQLQERAKAEVCTPQQAGLVFVLSTS